MKALNIIFTLTILLPVFLLSYDGQTASPHNKKAFAFVEKREIKPLITCKGTVYPERSVKIHSIVNGTIKELQLKNGKQLKRGELLLSLENRDLRDSLEKALLELKISEMTSREFKELTVRERSIEIEEIEERSARQIKEAEIALEEAREAHKLGLISKNDLEKAATALKQAERSTLKNNIKIEKIKIALEKDEASINSTLKIHLKKLAKIKEKIASLEIRSPIDGFISEISDELPSQANIKFARDINQGEYIARISSNKNFIVKAYLFENDLPALKKGSSADIIIDSTGQSFKGIVTEISPSPEQIGSAMKYPVIITIERDHDAAIPGYTARVIFKTVKDEKVLAVPISCLSFKNGLKYIEVERKGKVVPVNVRTGVRNNHFIEIVEGVLEGERIYYQNGESLVP